MQQFDTYTKLEELVKIDSPSGFTHKACKYVFDLLTSYGYSPKFTNKGAVTCDLGENPRVAFAAHIDTLGAIVTGVKGDGTLSFSKIGGPVLASFEAEYCRIYTLDDQVYTGTLLLNNPSVHTNRQAGSTKRELSSMHIRIDEEVHNSDDVNKLGIRVGDFICFDTKYQELDNGFIKSRFMDNKISCYVLFEVARRLKEKGQSAPIQLFFSNYEEVGHGGTCGYAPTIQELVVLDMGVVGGGTAGSEYHCSICAKDSTGPYDYLMKKRLVKIAESKNIPFKLDIYPYYGSDGSAALAAGNDFRVALIGPGVAASHGMERTHKKGVEATIDLCLAYIEEYQK